MQNYDAIDNNIKLPVGNDIAADTPLHVGEISAIPITSTDATNDEAACYTRGVFVLNVATNTDGGTAAIAVGDKLYIDGSEVNIDSTNGKVWGYALEPIADGETEEIRVLMGQF